MQKDKKSLETLTFEELQREHIKINRSIKALQQRRNAIVNRKKEIIANNRIAVFLALDKLWAKITKEIEKKRINNGY